jgi:hypothetical protein
MEAVNGTPPSRTKRALSGLGNDGSFGNSKVVFIIQVFGRQKPRGKETRRSMGVPVKMDN